MQAVSASAGHSSGMSDRSAAYHFTEVVCGGFFGAGGGRPVEPLAAGAVLGDGAGIFRGLRVVSVLRVSHLVARHGGVAAAVSYTHLTLPTICSV